MNTTEFSENDISYLYDRDNKNMAGGNTNKPTGGFPPIFLNKNNNEKISRSKITSDKLFKKPSKTVSVSNIIENTKL